MTAIDLALFIDLLRHTRTSHLAIFLYLSSSRWLAPAGRGYAVRPFVTPPFRGDTTIGPIYLLRCWLRISGAARLYGEPRLATDPWLKPRRSSTKAAADCTGAAGLIYEEAGFPHKGGGSATYIPEDKEFNAKFRIAKDNPNDPKRTYVSPTYYRYQIKDPKK